MISKELSECLPIIQLYMKLKGKKLRQDFLSDQFKQDAKIYKAIHEIVMNVVHQNLPIPDDVKPKLRRHKRAIIEFIHDKNKKRNRKHLVQSGGYLHYIIPAAIQLISSLLSNGGNKESIPNGR